MDNTDAIKLNEAYNILGKLSYKLDGEYWLDYENCLEASEALHDAISAIRTVSVCLDMPINDN